MAGRLYTELGIAGLADLQAALASGRLMQIKGIGERTIAGIREGIAAVADREERTLLLHAWQLGERLLRDIADMATVAQVAWSGSLRRGAPTVGDLDLVVASTQPQRVLADIAGHELLLRSEMRAHQLHAVLPNGMLLDVVVVDPECWASTLLVTTGSHAHVAWLQAQAAQRGWHLDQHGLRIDGTVQRFATEPEYYAALDMPWIAPELREWHVGDVAAQAQSDALVTVADIQADLHMHTTWSDGSADIRTMAESARQRGYRYAAITDHGALMGITNGLNTKRLREQRREIDAVNDSYRAAGIDFEVLRGVEVDILVDGSLALPNGVLHELDVVIASPHVNLRQTPEVATARLLRAIAHPAVDIIGHPRGRILGGRLGAPVDMAQVIAAAVKHGVALEVNSGPDRLDIDGDVVRDVLQAGGVISINSDAHAPENHAWMHQGVATARRGGASAAQVINTWSLAQLRTFLGRKRGPAVE
jgi:DNA polymerase (family 10)